MTSTNSERIDDLTAQVASLAAKLNTLVETNSASHNNIASISSPSRDDPPEKRFLKLDVPRFNGTDAPGWIFKITQFFLYHETPEEERIIIALFYLDGPTLAWYQ